MILYATLRELVLEGLLQTPRTQVANLTELVGRIADNKKLINRTENQGHMIYSSSHSRILSREDELSINQILWDLVAERIITPGCDNANPNWPFFRLTDFGKTVAADSSSKYYDPEGYIERLHGLVPDVDDVIIQYLSEALNCFRQNLFFSASVMCGAAAEKAVLILLGSIVVHEEDVKRKKQFEALLERPNLPKIFESIQRKIDHLIEKKELPYTVHQGSSMHLISLFEMIRVHRNEAVHPAAGMVSREKVFLSIQTIPEALRVLSKLKDWFNPK